VHAARHSHFVDRALCLHAVECPKQVKQVPAVKSGVEAVPANAQLLAASYFLQAAMLQSCGDGCDMISTIEEAQAASCIVQVLFSRPFGGGGLLVAVGALGGANPPCGVAAQVAVKLKCPKPTLLSLPCWIPITGNAELVGEGGQNVVGVSVNVGCEVLKEMLDAQLNLLAPFLPCQLLS